MSSNTILLILITHLLGLMIGLIACTEIDDHTFHVEVRHEGALKNFMKKGDVSAKTDLATFQRQEHLYALGAMENLKGEIQIFNGQPFHTHVINGALVVDSSFDQKASLLVYAIVRRWNGLSIPDHITNMQQLEDFIATAHQENNLDTRKPFPFLLSGSPKNVAWHVINWKEGDMEHTHEKHMSSGFQGSLQNTPVEMLGFYSKSHRGIFTHHTSNMHIHVKSIENSVAGHVDDLKLDGGMTLFLPAREQGANYAAITEIIGEEEYHNLMALSEDDFDQSTEGFRKHANNYGLIRLLIPEYISVNNLSGARSRNLHWHLGQIHAFQGNYDDAIVEMKQAYEGGSKTWEAYVNGSIAFLERDKPALLEALKLLEAQDNQMNISILRSFVKHFDKSYTEAMSFR